MGCARVECCGIPAWKVGVGATGVVALTAIVAAFVFQQMLSWPVSTGLLAGGASLCFLSMAVDALCESRSRREVGNRVRPRVRGDEVVELPPPYEFVGSHEDMLLYGQKIFHPEDRGFVYLRILRKENAEDEGSLLYVTHIAGRVHALAEPPSAGGVDLTAALRACEGREFDRLTSVEAEGKHFLVEPGTGPGDPPRIRVRTQYAVSPPAGMEPRAFAERILDQTDHHGDWILIQTSPTHTVGYTYQRHASGNQVLKVVNQYIADGVHASPDGPLWLHHEGHNLGRAYHNAQKFFGIRGENEERVIGFGSNGYNIQATRAADGVISLKVLERPR